MTIKELLEQLNSLSDEDGEALLNDIHSTEDANDDSEFNQDWEQEFGPDEGKVFAAGELEDYLRRAVEFAKNHESN